MTGLEETIYKDYEKSICNEDNMRMSDKVQAMANGIYQEFEQIIAHNDPSVFKNLMPLVVATLENLDELEKGRKHLDLEVEMLREDNSALMNQYEREKSNRKKLEEKLINLEYEYEDEKKNFKEKLEESQNAGNLLEVKLKNSFDIVQRMEDKEKEQKQEYQKLYDRYTELLKAYADQADKLKYCHSNQGTLQRRSVQRRHSKPNVGDHNEDDAAELSGEEELERIRSSSSLDDNYRKYAGGENYDLEMLEETLTNSMIDQENAEENLGDILDSQKEFQENTRINDIESDEECEHDDNEDFGFGREIENLIKENQDLVETKNALNIVKDDLIKKLDSICGENDILKSELDRMHNREVDIKARLENLQLEYKELRQQNEALKNNIDNFDDNKRFTRVEMAILLKERNQYKERLLELEDTLRYTEMIRATRQHPELMLDNHKTSSFGTGAETSSSTGNTTGIVDLFFGLLKKYDDNPSTEEENKQKQTSSFKQLNYSRRSSKNLDIHKKNFVFKEDINRSQLYGWSVPKDLLHSTLSNQVPTPVASHTILEAKDSIICVTKSSTAKSCTTNGNSSASASKSFIWVIVERPKQSHHQHTAYFLAQFSLCSRNEITPNNISFLKIPKRPKHILACPEISQIVEDRYSFSVDDFPSPVQSPNESSSGYSISDYVKVSRVYNTKAKLKSRSTVDIHSKTLWLSYDDGIIVIFSVNSSNSFDGRLATIFLPGSIETMKYCQGRVFVGLSDGCLCVFDLKSTNDQWEYNQCLIMEMSHSSPITGLEDHRNTGTLWFGSDQSCYVIGVNTLNFRKSFQVNCATNSDSHITRVECIYSSNDNQIMWVSMTHVGQIFAFDSYNYSKLITVDIRSSLLDIIEIVDKPTKASVNVATRFSFPIISEDQSGRLWLGSNCGFIICVPKSQLNLSGGTSTDSVIIPSQIYVSCHGFSGNLVSIVSLQFVEKSVVSSSSVCSSPSMSPPVVTKTPTCASAVETSVDTPLMIALGSSYVNLNSSPSKVSIDDYINKNNVLIWKLQ